jgi:hypothetical protein
MLFTTLGFLIGGNRRPSIGTDTLKGCTALGIWYAAMVIPLIRPCSLKRWDRALETFPSRSRQDQITSLQMIHSLTQAGNRFLRPLDSYIGAPHRPDVWFLCEALGSLFLKVDLGGHDVYTLNQTPHSTRYGKTYTYSHHDTGPCLESRHETINNWLGCTVKLHSLSPTWSPLQVYSPNQLLATLASWENQSLWKHLRINGGAGAWIFSSLMQRLLVIGHDGSYMPHLAHNLCACATVFYCSHTNQYMDVTWVEKSTKNAANNYRTKILGG